MIDNSNYKSKIIFCHLFQQNKQSTTFITQPETSHCKYPADLRRRHTLGTRYSLLLFGLKSPDTGQRLPGSGCHAAAPQAPAAGRRAPGGVPGRPSGGARALQGAVFVGDTVMQVDGRGPLARRGLLAGYFLCRLYLPLYNVPTNYSVFTGLMVHKKWHLVRTNFASIFQEITSKTGKIADFRAISGLRFLDKTE